jgi:hypothetical protein
VQPLRPLEFLEALARLDASDAPRRRDRGGQRRGEHDYAVWTTRRSISLLFFVPRFAGVDPPLAETTKLCGELARRFWLY